jgi:8-oxo-dGTP diphosphatase
VALQQRCLAPAERRIDEGGSTASQLSPGTVDEVRTEIRPVIEPENPPHDLMRAAGGVLVRYDSSGHIELALIHRPHREDWSFPKGKLDPGESFEDCALREVLEETGFVCRLERFVGVTEYTHRKGRPKIVAYWLMSIVAGSFIVNAEADEIRWCSVGQAKELASYDRDRELLEMIAALDQEGTAA